MQAVEDLILLEDGITLFSASRDGTIGIWNLKMRYCRFKLQTKIKNLKMLFISKDVLCVSGKQRRGKGGVQFWNH